ncbi:MAG: DegT/DnrJ/EryC1/StrS family aminotransferase [Cyanobacteria bacterium J06554_6]
MIPRKRLDISWSDLAYGMRCCLWSGDRSTIEARLDKRWMGRAGLPCLSVRSGVDALLSVLDFPTGSEILVSALTIKGMVHIIKDHGLVPVPIDLEMSRLSVDCETLKAAVTERTKAILVAHLFGSRMPMQAIVDFAQVHQLLVIEDSAQTYTGSQDWGHPQSDVSLFSFGPIKTATALGGGVLIFREPSLRDAVRAHQSQWPLQRRWSFWLRLWKYSGLMLLSARANYRLFVALCGLFNVNHDRLIASSVRGFAGGEFFAKIRQRPSTPLLSLMARRIGQFDPVKIDRRRQIAEQAIAQLFRIRRPGDRADHHTHWVFPILHSQPDQLIVYLCSRGFDATRGGSSLCVVEPPAGRSESRPTRAEATFEQLLYLPIYEGLSSDDVARLASAVNNFEAALIQTVKG